MHLVHWYISVFLVSLLWCCDAPLSVMLPKKTEITSERDAFMIPGQKVKEVKKEVKEVRKEGREGKEEAKKSERKTKNEGEVPLLNQLV